MAYPIRTICAVTLIGAALAACGGDSSAPPAPPPVVVTPAAKLEDGFGANFGTAYRTDMNTDAKDPLSGDLIPLDLTKDPVTI